MPLDHLAKLNIEQRRADEPGVGGEAGLLSAPLLVIAGAGSSKTNTLAHRVANLIVNGADPRRILLMTFSRWTATEMSRRVESICAKVLGAKARVMTDALTWAGAFHAIGAGLLRGLCPADRRCARHRRTRRQERRRRTDDQKRLLAQAIARRHNEATGAPAFFVQVEIDESETRTRFLGGAPSNTHVWIRADIRSGRSEVVRQRLMLSIMRDVSEITNVAARDIWVYICNLDATDMVEFGHVLPAPGKERAWFEALPSELQQYLEGLGAHKASFNL